jgi:hypothetical protein
MARSPQDLLDRITQEKFEFTLRGWKEPADRFFTAGNDNAEILAERRHWLWTAPERCLLYTPGSEDLVREASNFLQTLSSAYCSSLEASPIEILRQLGEQSEADLILCQKNTAGRICMQAGAICFPSHWAPETKLTLPIEALHNPVPGLNAAIGDKIFNLLDRLPSGYAWLRLNWGLSASRERNQHPGRGLPRLNPDTPIESIWLRVEHQALARLPHSQGILFGIRLYSYSLATLKAKPKAALAVAGQLRSMPEAMRVYKGIQGVADRVVAWLEHTL